MKKNPTKCKCYIDLFFVFCFFHSFVHISLMLFCLFSAVRHTHRLDLKLPPLIFFVMNSCAGFCAGKRWLFYSKLEVNVFFVGRFLNLTVGFIVSRFLVFIIFVIILPWIMMEIKRANGTNIQLIKMIMAMMIAIKSKEIVHHRKKKQKRNHHTLGERLRTQLVT